MGNGNSSAIIINLDRNNLFYYSGEIISGIVRLNITEESLETREIYISLIGEIGYETTRSVSNGSVGHHQRTESHRIKFYKNKVSLSGSVMPEHEFIYQRGHYSWPFQISLIDNLPPTINEPDLYPRVRYYLQVVIDRSWHSSNIKHKKHLTIYPRVNLLENPQCLTPCIFEFENRKEIALNATFNKLGYVSGENIQFTLEVQNPRKICIQHVNFSILTSYKIANNHEKYTLYKIMLPRIVNLTNEHIMETFSIKIPSRSLPPSYKFQGENTDAVVNVSYILKLTVKVDGILTNCHINIPITIGTEPNSDLNQQKTSNPVTLSHSSNPEQSIFNDNDSLPDYDSAVKNLR